MGTKKRSEMGDNEIRIYADLLTNTFRGLDEARDRHYERLAQKPPFDEKFLIKNELYNIKAHWNKVYNESLVFSAQSTAITPPSPADLSNTIKLTQTLDEIVASAQTTEAVVKATGEIMKTWNKTKPTGTA